jgi:succinate-semialdehyde dehydrogenase/glutarate-semialdehyde dehydrogenase
MTDYPGLFLHIDGEWIGAEGREVHRVVNPATEGVLAELPLATAADLDRALEAAERGFRLWKATPAADRAGVMRRAADLLRERADRIARIATLEQGKPMPEARQEVRLAADLFEFYGEEAKRIYGRVLVRPVGQRSLVMKEPIGPVAAFAPWNFPVTNPARKLGAPIATGCSVIVKPAEESPATALEVLRCLLDAGLPPGVAQMVFGVPDQVSRHLMASSVIRKMSFTGSTVVGRHLARLAADGLKRTTMELGGHAPVLVFDDADLGQAVDMLARTKFRNAGQVCVSPTRFWVQEALYKPFVEAFAARAQAIRVGDGLAEGTEMGPMANPRRLDAMESLTGAATADGAKRLTGGVRRGNAGYFWEPTVLSEVPTSTRIMNEEPFGPVAVINPFRTDEDAIAEANRLPFGLAAYMFTTSARRANVVSAAIESGMVGINTALMAAADAPFGGVKDSGWGAEDGPEGLEACLVTKTIHQI